jgi:hypothetical protein
MAIVGLVSGERSLGERRSQGSTSLAALGAPATRRLRNSTSS